MCLGVSQVEYLGHLVTASGIRPLEERVAAIRDFPRPENSKALQGYLGMINFYQRFILGAARLLKPLTDKLKGGSQRVIVWTEEMTKAFEACRTCLMRVAELVHPVECAELVISVDASDTHAGAALQQRSGQSGQLRPLGFFSKKLDAAQQKYSAFDKELSAVVLAIKHFHWAVEGRAFSVLTDHKPLTQAILRLADAWTARQQRHLYFIAEHTTDLHHVAGKSNVVADALSRYTVAAVAPAADGHVTVEELIAAQKNCRQAQEMRDREDVKSCVYQR